ncbi:MAG: phytanoyl-CoA dioxygenase family protein [Spirochaetia bacterium]|nr:phytanoyl-CoA dioxygenase family protein [Spirochaetia bacterium]
MTRTIKDLSFKPTVNDHPTHLTPEQVRHYNEQGYIRPLAIFEGDEATRIQKYFDFLLEEMRRMNDGREAYAINGYHTRCQGLWDIVMNPKILGYVGDLLGENFLAWGSHFFCKLPNDPKSVPWHQDASYWPLSPSRTVTVWLAIDDANEENSAMQFIPATHNLGPLEWKETDKPAVLSQEIVDIHRYGKPVVNALKAGQMSLHADMLAHGSTPNLSSRRRTGLTIRYCPVTVRSENDNWNKGAIICRGEDTSGHWTHNPRPPGEDLSLKNKPPVIGAN